MQSHEPGADFALDILVVDDNLAAAQLLTDVLRQLGHRTSTASNGAEAIRVAVAERPDVVVMDLRMPLVDGFEAARRIKTILPDVLIVAVSGHVGPGEMDQAIASGFDWALSKPVSPDRLQAVLRSLCAHS